MRNRILVVGLCLAFAAIGGCKKGGGEGAGGGGGAPCPAAKITVDGEAFPVAFALGYRDKTAGTYAVEFFNQPGVTCEQILAPMRQMAEGERGGSVFASEGDGGGLFGSGVSLESNAQLGGKTRLATKPAKPGDPLAICVPDAIEWAATVGSIQGKKVSIQGLFTGSYCGER